MEESELRITVKTPARLHLGILDVNGGLGRVFGSIGLAVEEPRVELEARESDRLIVEGESSRRAEEAVKRFFTHFDIEGACRIYVKRSIPEHIGLGSGTQLSLAVAKAAAELFGIRASVPELSKIMGRGSVSGIGTAVFEKGGFVVDGGVRSAGGSLTPPPVIARHPFPEDWFFVLAVPGLKKGFSGASERVAFKHLPQPPAELVGRMCRLLVVKMLPSLVEGDIEGFGSALTELQILTGECFSPVQGGRFSDSAAEEVVRFMLNEGAYGAGQSSWGPTVYGLVKTLSNAEALCRRVRGLLESTYGGYAFYTKADNIGAVVEVSR